MKNPIHQLFLFLALFLIPMAGCHPRPADQTVELPKASRYEGEGFVTVQHVLIKFDSPKRSQSASEQLAKRLFEEAKEMSNADFDDLVKNVGEDRYPAKFTIADHDVKYDRSSPVSSRVSLVPGFGDVSFSLEVGETKLLHYDFNNSKHGWHIIRRLK